MQTLLSILVFCNLLLPTSEILMDISDDVSAAVKTGNSGNVAKFFSTNVDLKILDKEDVYSKAQAELILRDFFAKNQVKAFTVIHKGTSSIGEPTNEKGTATKTTNCS